jgi:GNAT superfamily N-acetyltransferase
MTVHIRRVGFRNGTDEELALLHSIEVPIEIERGSNRMPRPLDAYIGFARSLPSQFDDHTLVAEHDDGTPLAEGACWSDRSGDPNVLQCDVLVLPAHRRRGVGTALLRQICERALAEDRHALIWETYSAVPAGEAFSRRVGARAARVARTSELRLSDVDWAMVDAWIDAAAPGYSLQVVDGPYPTELRADAARFHHIMQTMPMDDLDVAPRHITVDDVAERDRALVEARRTRWAVLVRDPDGECVGGTEIVFEPGDDVVAFQQNTGVDPDHRGRGLAKWAKAAVLRRLRDEAPHVERVQTGNAFSNAPMLAINDALGFRVTRSLTDWQADPEAVLRSLARR